MGEVGLVVVVGRDVIFVPILPGNEKLLLSSQSLLKGGCLKKYTQKNIAQATKTASCWINEALCWVHPRPAKKCNFGQKSGLMVSCLNLEIRWYAEGAASAFSSVKILSISQLCVKVLLNKNAQNIYRAHTNFQIIFLEGKQGLKQLSILEPETVMPSQMSMNINGQMQTFPKHLIPPFKSLYKLVEEWV